MEQSGVLHSNASSPRQHSTTLPRATQLHAYENATNSTTPQKSQTSWVRPQDAETCLPSPPDKMVSKIESLQQQEHSEQEAPSHSLYQRYFTTPVTSSTSTAKKNSNLKRHFSFLSLGALVLVVIMLIFFGIIAIAVALGIDRHHHRIGHLEDVEHIHHSPIRAAIPYNFPDPALWHVDGTWYAFATNNAAGVLRYGKHKHSDASDYTIDSGLANVQLATSTNFINWTTISLADQPLPKTGAWSLPRITNATAQKTTAGPKLSSTWAPAVIRRGDGKFVMYYSAGRGQAVHWADKKIHPHPHCVGAAVSEGDSPLGPYKPESNVLACPWEQGGAIDPEAFKDDDGTLYMLYKVDGNNIGSGGACGNTFKPIQKTPIMLQQMDGDGVAKVHEPIEVLTNEKQDGPLVEAPMLIKSDEGIYFLFFSSGCTKDPSYAVDYATATNITGPYTRADARLLKTGDWGLEAPGSVGIARDSEGSWKMAFHARVVYGEVGRVRAMFTTKLEFNGTRVTLCKDNSTVELEHHDRD